jgi:hypothetical protein
VEPNLKTPEELKKKMKAEEIVAPYVGQGSN